LSEKGHCLITHDINKSWFIYLDANAMGRADTTSAKPPTFDLFVGFQPDKKCKTELINPTS
jgi:hypothetical protein